MSREGKAASRARAKAKKANEDDEDYVLINGQRVSVAEARREYIQHFAHVIESRQKGRNDPPFLQAFITRMPDLLGKIIDGDPRELMGDILKIYRQYLTDALVVLCEETAEHDVECGQLPRPVPGSDLAPPEGFEERMRQLGLAPSPFERRSNTALLTNWTSDRYLIEINMRCWRAGQDLSRDVAENLTAEFRQRIQPIMKRHEKDTAGCFLGFEDCDEYRNKLREEFGREREDLAARKARGDTAKPTMNVVSKPKRRPTISEAGTSNQELPATTTRKTSTTASSTSTAKQPPASHQSNKAETTSTVATNFEELSLDQRALIWQRLQEHVAWLNERKMKNPHSLGVQIGEDPGIAEATATASGNSKRTSRVPLKRR